eukprot:SAG31_NODE_3666_length_4007_cov_11.238741_1_plen_257_part_00
MAAQGPKTVVTSASLKPGGWLVAKDAPESDVVWISECASTARWKLREELKEAATHPSAGTRTFWPGAVRRASLRVRQSNPELFGRVKELSTESMLCLGTETDQVEALTDLRGSTLSHPIKHDPTLSPPVFIPHQPAPTSNRESRGVVGQTSLPLDAWSSEEVHAYQSGAHYRPCNEPLENWSSNRVHTWLTVVELPEVATQALSNRVDGQTATKMDKADWRELGATGVQASRIIGMVERAQLRVFKKRTGRRPCSC